MLLDLGQARLLLGLELEALDLLAGLAHLGPGRVEGAVGLVLGRLGAHDALARLHDGGVELDVLAAVAEGALEDGAFATCSVGRTC